MLSQYLSHDSHCLTSFSHSWIRYLLIPGHGYVNQYLSHNHTTGTPLPLLTPEPLVTAAFLSVVPPPPPQGFVGDQWFWGLKYDQNVWHQELHCITCLFPLCVVIYRFGVLWLIFSWICIHTCIPLQPLIAMSKYVLICVLHEVIWTSVWI